MVPGATSVLVLMKVQATRVQLWVKPAVGGRVPRRGGSNDVVMLLVLVSVKP